MLAGRLGLETARIPHADRHGLLWLTRGNLFVREGTLRFVTAGSQYMDSGDYAIPYQMVSSILLGPGTTISHDVFRLCARHGTCIIAVGEDGIRAYTAPPLGPGDSAIARKQIGAWADKDGARITIARHLYAWRLGEIVPHANLNTLRGIEGARMKTSYRVLARHFGIEWHGRRYDRKNPDITDIPNQAINHAATAMEAAATVAVSSLGAIHSLGFIHEDPGISFILDIADLYRVKITVPVAFRAVQLYRQQAHISIDRHVRTLAGEEFRRQKLIPLMIDRIKQLFDGDGSDSDP